MDKIWAKMVFWLGREISIVLDFLQTFALRILDLYGKPFIDKRNWEAAVVLLHRRGGGGGGLGGCWGCKSL